MDWWNLNDLLFSFSLGRTSKKFIFMFWVFLENVFRVFHMGILPCVTFFHVRRPSWHVTCNFIYFIFFGGCVLHVRILRKLIKKNKNFEKFKKSSVNIFQFSLAYQHLLANIVNLVLHVFCFHSLSRLRWRIMSSVA